MARLHKITYGSLTLGKDQLTTTYHPSYTLMGKYRFSRDYERASISFEVMVSNTDRALFLAAEAALVSQYTRPDQTLTVVLGSTVRHTFDPAASANTGFNARAEAEKVSGSDSTANSARYRCTVVVELPADLSGRAYRRSSTVDVDTSPSGRRTLTIEGTYTAGANLSARAAYAAAIGAYASSVLSDLGGTWELVGVPRAVADDQNKVIRFSRRYEEIKYDQAEGGVTDHAAIVSPSLVFTRRVTGGESAPEFDASSLVELEAEYSCSVDFATTTDLPALWRDTIRPYVLAKARVYAALSTVIVVGETFRPDPVENRITASLTLVADTGASFYQSRISYSEEDDYGVVLRAVWNGDPYARDKDQDVASLVRTLSITTVAFGSAGSWPLVDHGKYSFPGWVEVRQARRLRPFQIGIPGEKRTMQARTTTYVFVRANVDTSATSSRPLTGGSGSTGGSGFQPPTGATGQLKSGKPMGSGEL